MLRISTEALTDFSFRRFAAEEIYFIIASAGINSRAIDLTIRPTCVIRVYSPEFFTGNNRLASGIKSLSLKTQ